MVTTFLDGIFKKKENFSIDLKPNIQSYLLLWFLCITSVDQYDFND